VLEKLETGQKLLDELINLEKIKVWSLIVTLFGDLDSSGSQSLSGKQINTLFGHIGIKPEATRVALHRLKNENWIETSKSGRETLYRLSNKAKRETTSVYDEVYGTSIKYLEGWQLHISQETIGDDKTISVPILKHISLVPAKFNEADSKTFKAEIAPQNIPDWVSEKLITSKTLQIVEVLNQILFQHEDNSQITNSLDKTAIRLLILHRWRKLALRDAVWCYIWLEKDSALAKCQKAVSRFLKQSPSINLSELQG